MNRIVCEKTLFNILYYRHHNKLYKYSYEYPYNNLYRKSTLNWIVHQSDLINKMGFDNWYKNSDGPLGIPNDLSLRIKSFDKLE